MTNILIADDNDINRRLLNWQLDTLGFSCHDAASGQDALNLCAVQRYSIILMDLNLGDTDGYTVTRKVRAMEGDARTPIVAVTAHTGLQEYERCMAADMDDFLSKPIALSPLARLLIRWGTYNYEAPAQTDPDGWLLPTALDWLRALEKNSAHKGLVREIANDFLDRAPAHLRRLRSAIASGHDDKRMRARFALQKHSLGIGAARLAAAITAAEDAGGDDATLATVEQVLRDTSTEIERSLGQT